MKVVVATATRNATAAIGMLVTAQTDLRLVGEAADLTELLVLVKSHRPDVIVLHWDAFGDRIDQLHQLLELFETSPAIVALSVNDQLRDQAIANGVTQFAHMGSPPTKLLEAIRQTDSSGNPHNLSNTIKRDSP